MTDGRGAMTEATPGPGGALAPRPILVLDFDGTVCLGDAPVLRYAEEVALRLPADRGADLRSGVQGFLAGTLSLPESEDGYYAVVELAREELPAESMSQAYLASRAALEADDTYPPDGLGEFLDEMRDEGAVVVLVTNAPLVGVDVWLTTHGLAQRLDAVVPDAGKPARMAAVLRGILQNYDAQPHHLASVGDVWANDIEPAISMGGAGMYIDRFGSGRGPATVTAKSFPGLYPQIRQWVRAVRGTGVKDEGR